MFMSRPQNLRIYHNRKYSNNNKVIIVKMQGFLYRDTTNVEPEMYGCTSNNWSHWNSNKKLKENFGNCTRKTFDRFTTRDSCTWNSTHNTESTAVWSLKRERWRSRLVQEKYQEEKACDKTSIIIIIIINFNSVVTQWQWLFYMYTKYEIGY